MFMRARQSESDAYRGGRRNSLHPRSVRSEALFALMASVMYV